MKQALLIFYLMIWLTSGTHAQSYLGKHFFITAGVGLSANTKANPKIREYAYHNLHGMPFPMKVGMEAGWATNGVIALTFSTNWKPLRNSTFEVMDSRIYSDYYYSDLIYKDIHQLRSDAWEFGLSMKVFFLHAPVGPYFNVGIDNYQVFNTVYTTLTEYSNEDDDDAASQYYVERRLDPWKARLSLIGFHLGFGKTGLIGHHVLIDWGGRVNITFADRSYSPTYNPQGIDTDYDFENQGEEFIKPIMPDNLFSSNLFEFYVKVGYKH